MGSKTSKFSSDQTTTEGKNNLLSYFSIILGIVLIILLLCLLYIFSRPKPNYAPPPPNTPTQSFNPGLVLTPEQIAGITALIKAKLAQAIAEYETSQNDSSTSSADLQASQNNLTSIQKEWDNWTLMVPQADL